MLVLSLFSLKAQVLPTIQKLPNGGLKYTTDEKNNRIPDFSYCGYHASEKKIPWIEPKIFVPLVAGDATSIIQEAIDKVSILPILPNGSRGAIQLAAGTFYLNGRLTIHTSGVVLRGAGFGSNGTTLVADGQDRQTLIRVIGSKDHKFGDPVEIVQDYIPVNATKMRLKDVGSFQKGDNIIIKRPSNLAWINFLNMGSFGGEETSYIGWKPGQRDILWERTIADIKDDTLFWRVPLTMAFDKDYTSAQVYTQKWKGRIREVGIENMKLVSAFNSANGKDEDHCFNAISIENAEDVWVRQIQFHHFAGSAVAVYESARKVTVQDCLSLEPISEEANWRRYTFFTMGQQTLFQRLYAENGYHDFAVGFSAAGPNAFVECESSQPLNFSGTIDSWASGVLFDVVKIDGGELFYGNRMGDNQGAGWTATQSVFWNCSAARIKNYAPPGEMNYAFGVWAAFEGDGSWNWENNHANPRSLYYAQLAQRLGKDKSFYSNCYMPPPGFASTSPTIEQAMELTAEALNPAPSLYDFILDAPARDPIKVTSNGIAIAEEIVKPLSNKSSSSKFEVENGWLTLNESLLTGMRMSVPWWRGVARPYEAQKAQPAITRFVPGRNGNGYTDNLDEVVDYMKENNLVGIEHNYGLWYERRRDDHERVRRMDAEVWAPFYDQPFARSGKGAAWDQLSKYDLTKYNSFYWSRLAQFADLASQNQQLLVHQHYFQHNILEAGAHWADSPWRPANNINDTGFPEPVPYAGDKRIFFAEQFYDVSHPVRRAIHRAYIRQCLDNFSLGQPVLHLISAEYTGPLHFVKFWLDVIKEWQNETGKKVMVALSTTKDVQDMILQDPEYNVLIDVIDIRYWAYRDDGTLYEPPGGANLSPRQHARLVNSGKRSFQSVYRSVAEYKELYPEKAVIYSEGQYDHFGWAVCMAGGSLPVLPAELPQGLRESIVSMIPDFNKAGSEVNYKMVNSEGESLIYLSAQSSVNLDFVPYKGRFNISRIHLKTGEVIKRKEMIKGGSVHRIVNDTQNDMVVWVHKR